MALPSDMREPFKIVTVGDCGVGKTSLILKLAQADLAILPNCTVGVDFFDREVTIKDAKNKNQTLLLQLWDTAGEERFKDTLSNAYFRNCRVAIFVFSMEDENSLKYLDKWIDDALCYSPQDVKLFLCGNKCDQKPELPEAFYSQADYLAQRYGVSRIYYTSALTGQGIVEFEEALARELLGMAPLKHDGAFELHGQSDSEDGEEDSEIENPRNCSCG